MKAFFLFLFLFLFLAFPASPWGFYAHKKINYYSVFLLPPPMLRFYKSHIDYLSEHAVDPDKRRYALPVEGPRHFIDLDHYGKSPFDSLPRGWMEAVAKFGEDSLNRYGILPWWIGVMRQRLIKAFRERNGPLILKLSADIGHYIADAHVPLHACSNHNGQKTGQKGIHAFWESRLPELLAETDWDFFIGKASYISNTQDFIWKRILESAAAADTVLQVEKELSQRFPPDRKYAWEARNGQLIRQYATAYSLVYNEQLKGMVERRMRASVWATASFWYSAWIDAGQPDLSLPDSILFSPQEKEEWEHLDSVWMKGSIIGREE